MTAPNEVTLNEQEVLALARAGRLPAAWRTLVLDHSLRPLVRAGTYVTVTRTLPRPGAVVCLPGRTRLFWRRALAVRGGACLVRREVGPFCDGWTDAAIGVAQIDTVVARVAARLPSVWTRCGWWTAATAAAARGVVGRMHGRFRAAAPLEARALTPHDLAERSRFLERVYPGRAVPSLLAVVDEVEVGLWSAAGAMVGRSCLSIRDACAWSHTTMVDPAFRGRGGGGLLVRAAVEQARLRSARSVRAYVGARNPASLAAYRRAGFVATGRWLSDGDEPWIASERQAMELEALLA